jgi:hypothetical protein
MGWPPFIVVHCVGAMRPVQGERKGGDSSVQQQSEHLLVWHKGVVAMGAA